MSLIMRDFGYDLTIFPALATPEYQIYSGDKNRGGIGDNLARSPLFPIDVIVIPKICKIYLNYG